MKYCSLGETCQASYTLQSLGLKTESYPFDWVSSKSEIVKLCIEDEFKTFLDRSLYTPHELKGRCYHKVYAHLLETNPVVNEHIFFRHRDPLRKNEDYQYYIRCVDRFNKLLASDEEKVFIKTYLHKQPEESLLDDAISLSEFIGSYTTNYKVIAVRQAVTGEQSLKMESHKNLIYAEITTIDDSDGGTFYNSIDYSFFKALIEHFINKS